MSGALPSNAVSTNGIGVVPDSLLNAFSQVAATASVLRNFVGLTNMSVNLLGITAPGDGQGGLFYWANGGAFTDDNLNVIVPPAAAGKGAWLRAAVNGFIGPYLPLSGGVITGNLVVDGTFQSDGAATLANGGTLQGTFGGDPTFSGNAIFSGAGTGLSVTHDAAIGGNFTVTGATTLSGGGTVSGTFAGAPTFSGDVTFSGVGTGLSVTNNATIGGTLGVTGKVTAPNFSSAVGTNLIISPGGNTKTITFGDPGYGIGTMGSMTMGVGASAAAMIWNGTLQSQFYTTPSFTYTLSGGQTAVPLNVIASYAGSSSATQNLASLFVANDTLSGSGGLAVLNIGHTLNTGATNGRIGVLVDMSINSAIVGDTSNQQYQVGYGRYTARANVGGTNTTTSPSGYMYGFGSQVVLASGATNWGLANAGGEDDLAVQTGATVRDAFLRSFILLDTHAVAASRANYGLFVGAQSRALNTIERAFVVGGLDGPVAMSPTGMLLSIIDQSANGATGRNAKFAPTLLTYGMDVANANFSKQSGATVRGPGFLADGTGKVTAANRIVLGAASVSGIATIDVPNAWVVQSVAVNVAGTATGNGLNNYYVGDIVRGTSVSPNVPGQYEIATLKALAATIVSGGSGGTNGAAIVTLVGGAGSAASFNVTIAGGTITAVNSVAGAGSYSALPPLGPSVFAVTGGGLTGATLNVGMGAATLNVLAPDVFATNVTAITPTGGSGLGLTLTATNAQQPSLSIMPTSGSQIGFYGTTPTAKQTGVAVTAAGIHAALTSLGLIAP